MIINNINFGPVWAASGALGFFGEGYWFHRSPLLNTTGLTFVAKTVTTAPIDGHMPLNRRTWQPIEWIPRCIWVNPWRGTGLNAVGLSNFGIEAALRTERWQQRPEPFQLSWMPMPGLTSAQDRYADARQYVSILKPALKDFEALVALQLNLSCPNTEENLTELIAEAAELIKILKELEIPIIIKVNVLTRPGQVLGIYREETFDGVVVSNTLPFGEQTPHQYTQWPTESPLAKRGFPAGGLSGTPLFPLVKDWVIEAIHHRDLNIPINWCGGIMSVTDARNAMASDTVHSISLGTMLMVRPWRVQRTIRGVS